MSHIVCVLLLLLNFVLFVAGAQGGLVNSFGKSFSIEVKNQDIQEVVAELEKKSERKIVLSESLRGLRVSGSFSNVTLDEFFNRALKNKNIVVESGKDKIVIVHSFNEKNAVGKNVNDSKENVRQTEEFRALHEEQLSLLKQRQNDPEAKDPMTGLRSGDLRALQAQQLESFKQQQSDPETKDPMTGLRSGDLQALQAQQLESFNQKQDDPEAKDPMTGLRAGDLRALQARQLESFKQRQNDPEAKDPMTGLRAGDLRELQKKQLENFNSRR